MGSLCSRYLKQQLDNDIGFDIPTEIITDEIVSRLPVKSILKLRSVSKPWLSPISDPSFINLQLTHATTSFFIPAHDRYGKLHLFSGNDHRGGSLTRVMTLHHNCANLNLHEHLNGLVLLTFMNTCLSRYDAVVVNPSTCKMLKLGHKGYSGLEHVKYFFGFDEYTNRHKILRMRGALGDYSTMTFEMIVLSRSNYSWRKIDASFDIDRNIWSRDIRKSSVCVNSVIHVMLPRAFEILAFDLRTDAVFSIKVPINEMHYDLIDRYGSNAPYLMKINGCIGVVCYHTLNTNEIDIWILQDYENRVWVKETIILPWQYCAPEDRPIPLDSLSMDEIIFSVRKYRNMVSVPIYNMKNGRFRTVEFTHPLPCSPLADFYQIKCYLESITPLLVT
ncbi:putative F-box protein At1g47790 [Bidens hawaiensis]|uniref:putative F-box protein At1g47790 n=1 Tax=Bidens hawaiensis TaxID=980011 RepID=UPI004049E359